MTLYAGGMFGLYKSGNCGQSWDRLTYAGTVNASLQNQIFAYNELAISPSGRLFTQRARTIFWTSADDGTSWEGVPLGAVVDQIAFGPGGTAWAVGERLMRANSSAPIVATSTDDGRTWTVWDDELSVRLASGIFAVDPVDETHLFVGRRDGRLTRSSVAARTDLPIATFPAPVIAVSVSDDGRAIWVALDDGTIHWRPDRDAAWRQALGTSRPIRRNGLQVMHGSTDTILVLDETGQLWLYREPAPAP